MNKEFGASGEAATGAAEREHWENVFREKAEGEVSWFQERPATSLDLIGRTRAGVGAKIVDVGAGASRLVDALLQEGYQRLTVVDIAAAALEKSRRRLGALAERVRWITSDIGQWMPGERFDVWHDRAVFHFMVEGDARSAYLRTLQRALEVGGHAIIATFASDGPERCSGLPIQRYEPEELAAQLGPSFRLVESVREEHHTPGGKVQSFQYSMFRRLA